MGLVEGADVDGLVEGWKVVGRKVGVAVVGESVEAVGLTVRVVGTTVGERVGLAAKAIDDKEISSCKICNEIFKACFVIFKFANTVVS